MTSTDVTNTIATVNQISDTILSTIAASVPGASVEVNEIEGVTDLLAQLASVAITAFSNAAGVSITDATILALKSNPNPLSLPASS